MPLFLNATYPGQERRAGLRWPRIHRPGESCDNHEPAITIGLVNNMSDSALSATEHQFLTLLDAASGDTHINLSLYTLPGVARKAAGQRHISSFYTSVESLWQLHPEQYPDALIVTGAEPLTADLRDESYWSSFTRTLDWAKENTCSTVWSCLAAHAAILYMDDIRRIRSKDKHFGIFEVSQLQPHALTACAAASFKIPHSRWNGIAEDALNQHGYDVLTRTNDGGVDTFVKQGKSLFVYFQGHPEYESDTLLREYRRDVRRYLKSETETYPLLPRDYFDQATAAALNELRDKALATRSEKLAAEVSGMLRKTHIRNTWHSSAALLYRNWLGLIRKQKELRGRPQQVQPPQPVQPQPAQPQPEAISA